LLMLMILLLILLMTQDSSVLGVPLRK